jgi:hypothetical protein
VKTYGRKLNVGLIALIVVAAVLLTMFVVHASCSHDDGGVCQICQLFKSSFVGISLALVFLAVSAVALLTLFSSYIFTSTTLTQECVKLNN